jgi:phospholipid/cholesterol/gamma-HCH transport system substrate-binding protein
MVAVVAFIWLAENAYNGLPLMSYRTLYVSVPNIGHLQRHDPVDIAGVRVGQVVTTATRNNQAVVKLQLQGVGPLPVDSRVVIRALGLLGERYVELDPGASKQTIPNDGTIVEHNKSTSYYAGIPETLDLFNAKTRTALGQMLNGFGEGVAGRGSQLNAAIHVLAPSGADFNTAAYSILARGNGATAASFLPQLSSGATALDTARFDLTNMFEPAAHGLAPLVQERAATDRGLGGLVHMWSTSSGFGVAGVALTNALTQTAFRVDPLLPVVTGALRSATALLKAAPGPLQTTKLVLNEVPTAVPATLRILSALRPDLSPLKQGFTSLIGPVTSLAEHGCDIQNLATDTRSLVGWGTNPGGNWGPESGFPISLIVNPTETTVEANSGIRFPTEDYYPAPCAYSPGATISDATFAQVLTGVFR